MHILFAIYVSENSKNNNKNVQADPTTPTESDLQAKTKEFHASHGPILNLQSVIQSQSPAMALAGEFKRASPSKGDIATNLNAGEQAAKYASSGASTISVLTETRWFKGSLDDLTEARIQTTGQSYNRPAILRKDFVINKYQIIEAASCGADTILLIVAVTPADLLKELIDYARSIGMEPLVEVHAGIELDVALGAGAKVIGVNNRNLHTFQMDLSTTDVAAEELKKRELSFNHDLAGESEKPEYSLCSLSGMSSAHDVDRYRQVGVGMCLIGESLMRAADPSAAIQALCLHPDDYASQTAQSVAGSAYTAGTKLVKVCGITNPDDALVACRSGASLIGVIFAEKSKRKVSPEQASDVVNAVRGFGERSNRETIPLPNIDRMSSTQALVAKSRALEMAARRPLVVGVFQNQEPEFIREMVEKCGLDLVQLHGKEGMKAASVENCGVPAIRVVDIETGKDGNGGAPTDITKALLDSVTSDPIAILLDTSIKGSKEGGGTGVTFDWGIAEDVQNSGLPVIIAGGLKPDNVDDAVTKIRPWGIDVSSGVEEKPGKKNVDKVQTFVQSAKRAAVEALKGF
uniref:Indole-3-glycerol phosphate synthase n=1 Tax=Ditylum brightwellii TaxID=49249 RepID=A0A7S4RTT9_9STRA